MACWRQAKNSSRKLEALYSSHMSTFREPPEENIGRAPTGPHEQDGHDPGDRAGVTGGEEDGVDNTSVDESRLYTQPEEVGKAYATLNSISEFHGRGMATCTASTSPATCGRKPAILKASQDYIAESLAPDCR
jgi:fructose-bisphosphate aldolase class II